jgi:uncharacterized protein
MESATALTIDLGDGSTVSALLRLPPRARAVYALAHGAGAGMDHPFLNAVSDGLAARDVATLRYQFPFMERGSKRPDPPRLAQATVRAAVAAVAQVAPDLALFAGGKSFGGRMSSQAQAAAAMPSVLGLAFLGFPLHPAKQPASERAEHLAAVTCPMLFLQGTRDELADLALMTALCERLGPRATLALVDDADHSFHVRARSGRNDAQALAAMLDTMAAWMTRIAAA